MKKSLVLFCLLVAVGLTARTQSVKKEIETVLLRQQDCWNAGDIDCFMENYLKGEELVFIGSSGLTYGWETTRDNYKKNYPDQVSMGQLVFEVISVAELGEKHAFVIGSWDLTREIGDIGGVFSLVWEKVEGEWVIVADHTSSYK